MTNDELKALADEYFDAADIADWRISEAALCCGLATAEILHPDKNAENCEALKYIKLKLESAYELRLNKRGNTGDVFALRCLGWNDKDFSAGDEKAASDRVSLSELFGEKF